MDEIEDLNLKNGVEFFSSVTGAPVDKYSKG